MKIHVCCHSKTNVRLKQQQTVKETANFCYFSGTKMMYGLFFPMAKKGTVFVVDTVRSDQMPNLNAMFNSERNVK